MIDYTNLLVRSAATLIQWLIFFAMLFVLYSLFKGLFTIATNPPEYGPPMPTRMEQCAAKHGSYFQREGMCIDVKEIPLE